MTTTRLRFKPGTSDEAMTSAVGEAGGFDSGALVQVEIEHDDSCPRLLGRACKCEPTITATVCPPPSTGKGGDA